MTSDQTTVRFTKAEKLFRAGNSVEILPQFLAMIEENQRETKEPRFISEFPTVGRDFEACRQVLVGLGFLPIMFELAIKQDSPNGAEFLSTGRDEKFQNKEGSEKYFVSQLISYIRGSSNCWVSQTLLNAWRMGITDITQSKDYQDTIVGSTMTYKASLIESWKPESKSTVDLELYNELRSTHDKLDGHEIGSYADGQKVDKASWTESAISDYSRFLYFWERYPVNFDLGESSESQEDKEKEERLKDTLSKFSNSITENLDQIVGTREITSAEKEIGLNELKSLIRLSHLFVIPFVRPWLGIDIPRDPKLSNIGLPGEPGGCLFVLCRPTDLSQNAVQDVNQAALLLNSILNRAALIEARQQRVHQKKRDQVSSLHALTTDIISMQGTIRSARFALKGKRYEEATIKIGAAEAGATRLLDLREAAVKVWKIDQRALSPMEPNQEGSGADLRALVSSLVDESIRTTVESKKRHDWDLSREFPIDNDSSWTAVKALTYDESYLRLTILEALMNCVNHGTGQDGTVLNAGVEALKGKSYLILHVINQLQSTNDPRADRQEDRRLEREIRERRHDKLGLFQMTQAARAWTFPPPELTVDLKKRRFIAKIYIAMKC